jgi:prepilin-type N-terminal cleavage/methylation domain-containing protein
MTTSDLAGWVQGRRRRCARRDALAAFTLVEVMLAVTIFGIVAVTVYGTFSRTLRSKQIAETRVELVQSGRSAVARMADEITTAFYPDPPQPAAVFRHLPGGTASMPLDSLVFSALSSRPSGSDGRDSDQRVIGYFFPEERGHMRNVAEERGDSTARSDAAERRDGIGRSREHALQMDGAEDFFAAFGPSHPPIAGVTPQRLLRREALMTGPDALDTAPATAFLEDVASLGFRFHDGTDWLDAWDSDDRAHHRPLPRAVAIDLALYDAGGVVHHFTTAVDLVLADPRPGPRRSSPAVQATPRPTPTRSTQR